VISLCDMFQHIYVSFNHNLQLIYCLWDFKKIDVLSNKYVTYINSEVYL